MSAPSIAAAAPPERAELRKLLAQRLPSDADFNAFCLDYFSDVQRRFSAGMNRLEKENLLIELVPSDQIAARLPAVLIIEHSVPRVMREPRLARTRSWGRVAAILFAVAALLTAAYGGGRFLSRSPSERTQRSADAPHTAAPAPPPAAPQPSSCETPEVTEMPTAAARLRSAPRAPKRSAEPKKPGSEPSDASDVFRQILR